MIRSRIHVRDRSHLRICQVIESTGAGVGRHTLDLVNGLHELGHEVHLLYSPLRAEPSWIDRMHRLRCFTHAIDMPRSICWRDATATLAVRNYLHLHGPFDIVHGQSSKGGAIARLAAVGSGVAVVYTPHAFAAMDPAASNICRRLYGNMERGLAHLTNAVICVSPEERAFAQALGLTAAQLRMIPNGIDEEQGEVDPENSRAALQIPEQAVVIGFVGRLTSQKAPELLLEAFERISNSNRQAVVVYVGEGPLYEELRERAVELGLETRVRFLGWRDGRKMMHVFDLLALPSRYEGLPYVALEAIAAGLPVVATNIAGCRLIVDDRRNGFIVPPNRADLFAEALRVLVEDPAMRLQFSAASRAKARFFRIDRMISATLSVYQSLVDRPAVFSGRSATTGRVVPQVTWSA
jgi:glycosyltransferase involved in cell wall biosynthesis